MTWAAKGFGVEKDERPSSLLTGLRNLSDPPVRIFNTIIKLDSIMVIASLINIYN